MSIVCCIPILEGVYCLACARWVWKKCLYTAGHESENWGLATFEEFMPVPHHCRLILAVYEDDLRNPIWAPPGGYGINPDWVLLRKDYEETQCRVPPYMIYLDHDNADIVLVVRGLNLAKEADYAVLLDNKLGQAKFDGGYVHNGLLKAAQWLFDAECEFLRGLVEKNPNYTLTFTGHSLGAGVVTLLVLVLVQNLDKLGNIDRKKIRCFAMAPARCMSLNLAVRYADIINSIVLQDDFLPRTTTALDNLFKSLFCLPCLLCLMCLKDTCTFENILKDPRRLYAPGRLYHIVERKPFRVGRFPPVVRTAVPVDGRFEHIVISCNATSDHAIIWIERESQMALDLMLEKDRIMEIPATQRMERQESLVREHSVEYKAALERAVALDIPLSYSPPNYGTFHDMEEGETSDRSSEQKKVSSKFRSQFILKTKQIKRRTTTTTKKKTLIFPSICFSIDFALKEEEEEEEEIKNGVVFEMIVSQKMVAEAEIMCKSIPSTTSAAAAAAAAAALDVQYHVCVAKEQNFQIDVNVKNGSSPSTPVIREVRVSESVSSDISRFESEVSCSETIKSAVVESSPVKFVPSIRSGSYADIGTRDSMEDEHIQIDDLSAHLGSLFKCPMPSAFYAVFDGHGGPEAAAYIKKNAMKLFFEDAELPETSVIDDAFLQELENSHRKAFLLADLALADERSVSCTCGTTALTALILGSRLLVANAGDCRAVLCQKGKAVAMSHDHRPSYPPECKRVEELGGCIIGGYLNGLSLTRALGDWELKFPIGSASPLIAEPDVKQVVLTKDDEFLIIGCDGIWDVMTNQYAVSFVRFHLRQHNDPQQSAQELVKEALRLHSSDNVTVIVICLSSPDPPQRRRFRCASLSEDARSRLKSLLEGN